jgi:hypothetical protein
MSLTRWAIILICKPGCRLNKTKLRKGLEASMQNTNTKNLLSVFQMHLHYPAILQKRTSIGTLIVPQINSLTSVPNHISCTRRRIAYHATGTIRRKSWGLGCERRLTASGMVDGIRVMNGSAWIGLQLPLATTRVLVATKIKFFEVCTCPTSPALKVLVPVDRTLTLQMYGFPSAELFTDVLSAN